MNPQETIKRLELIPTLLSEKNDEYALLIRDYAKKEGLYNMAVAKEALRLREEGTPVTLMDRLIKGDKHVAKLRWQYIVAEGVMNACMQGIKDLRSESDSLRSRLTWLRVEKDGR